MAGNRVVVGDATRRISVFDTTGTLVRTFSTRDVQLRAGDVEVLDDRRVLVVGTKRVARSKGMEAHIFAEDGSLVRGFMPLSPSAEEFNVPLATPGGDCTHIHERTVWCVQALEYVLRKFDQEGMQTDSIVVNSDLYRPLRRKLTHSAVSEAGVAWLGSWDLVQGLHILNDTLLVARYHNFIQGNEYWDFINSRTGEVLVTHEFGGSLRDVDTGRQMLVFERPATLACLPKRQFVGVRI